MGKMTTCRTCGANIAKSATTCPHCGAKKKKHTVLGTILTVLGVLLLIGALGGNPGSSGSTSESNAAKADDIFYVESGGKLALEQEPVIVNGQYGNLSVDGAVVNEAGTDLTYVQITFALYDSEGAQVGSAVANINNLAEGIVWKYSAVPLTMEAFESFELTDISAR